MNWYFKSRKAMALEPGAWATDPDPHRQRKHHETVNLPWGRVRQKVNREELERLYPGVHLTDSFEIAAAYANSKSKSNEDPPIVIEIYSDGFERQLDADAKEMAEDIQAILRTKAADFKNILSRKGSADERVDRIIEDLRSDVEAGDFRGDGSDPADIIWDRERPPIEQAIIVYLEKFSTAEEALRAIEELMNGNVPDEVAVTATNQYRVLHPVGEDKVHAIYSIVRTNLDEYVHTYDFDGESEETLKEHGVVRVGREYFSEDGRKLIDIEDIEAGGWIEKTLLYKDPNEKAHGRQFTYHGTSYSRAKQAFPTLLK